MSDAKQAEAERIGELIANLRERKGWSQQDLAHEVGLHISTVSRWERGLHKGYSQNVRKLAAALDVEPSVLLPADDLIVGSQLDRIEAQLRRIEEVLSELREAAPAEEFEQALGVGEQPPAPARSTRGVDTAAKRNPAATAPRARR